jgi:ABC-type transport system involved in cytochrome c biogenesis permease subunit
MMTEPDLLTTAVAAYALAAVAALRGLLRLPAQGAAGDGGIGRALAPERLTDALLWIGLGLHTGALGLRWHELGHGPFTTLYEVISSNLWSLTLVIALLRLALPELRRGAWLATSPVLATLAAWAFYANPGAGHLPPTYATPLLYVHAVVGKAYLGLLLAAAALAAVPLARRSPWGRRQLAGPAGLATLSSDTRLDELAHRCAAAAFIFDSLMLIVGACWAQDAWGRYWAWDPLESWAFLSWLALAFTLHARVTVKLAPHHHALLLTGVFVLAFLTFFGVPFISTAPHKGAV